MPDTHAAKSSSTTRSGLLLAAIGSIAFSGKAIVVKLAYRHGVDVVTLLMLRMVFALPFFAFLAWWSGRGQVKLSHRDWLGVFGLGFTGYYLASFLDFWGLQLISASLERLILYLNPTLVLLLGWLLYGRRVTKRQAFAVVLSYAGVLVVFGHEASLTSVAGGTQTSLGALLVFGSAVSYSLYLLYSGQLVQRLGALRLAGWASCVACLLCAGQFLWLRNPNTVVVTSEVLWLSVLNATLCTVLPVMVTMVAIGRIGSATVAQVGMIGPLSTIAMGVVLLNEPFGFSLLIGTVLVFSGVLVVSRSTKKQ